ncbi:cAMP-regulated phosphoprotein 19-like [Sorex araneus]|uniref:cAMP-regulated phosphoprotein 19-like n=1 Tax=Sorex araneus TaxID=42254 RepID=UPI002433C7C2|nr:cAMP-regulated phosphoprotein 19-like [Sorex araneus]
MGLDGEAMKKWAKESLARQYQAVRTHLLGSIPPNRIILFHRGSIELPEVNDTSYFTNILETQKNGSVLDESFEASFEHEMSDKELLKFSFLQASVPNIPSSLRRGGSPSSRPISAGRENMESYLTKGKSEVTGDHIPTPQDPPQWKTLLVAGKQADQKRWTA